MNTAGDGAPLSCTLEVLDRAVAIEAARGGPPPEVLEQMAGASEIHAGLRRSGAALRFSGGEGEGLRIELWRDQGASMRTLTASEAVAIAAGEPVL